MKENKGNLSVAESHQKHGEMKLLNKEKMLRYFSEHRKGRKDMERANMQVNTADFTFPVMR